MTRRQTTVFVACPLKKATGAEGWRDDIVIDYSTIPARAGRRILDPAALLCRIASTGKYGPYDPRARDGRQTVSRLADSELQTCVNRYHTNVTTGDQATEAYYHNCVFDLSVIRARSQHGSEIAGDDLAAAFPTCIIDD